MPEECLVTYAAPPRNLKSDFRLLECWQVSSEKHGLSRAAQIARRIGKANSRASEPYAPMAHRRARDVP